MTSDVDLNMWRRYRDSETPTRSLKAAFLEGVQRGRDLERAIAAIQRILDMADDHPETFALWKLQNPDLVRRLYLAIR